MSFLMVALGAAVGAPTRYLVDQAFKHRLGKAFPWGTLTVNVVGSLILGSLLALPLPALVLALLGTGFCGALTTYSTFAHDAVSLAQANARSRAVVYVLANLVLGLGAAWLGLELTRLLTGS